ncbi:hypothetical protein [Neobacillus niacini]|nr:hypothetical protein [Neobacillus niacini]MDR6999697.1 hypothetical protein [Neobacillus niacini]
MKKVNALSKRGRHQYAFLIRHEKWQKDGAGENEMEKANGEIIRVIDV